jgi:8-oxo-dGTP pyrophosphatase MutT (NUDIX family)
VSAFPAFDPRTIPVLAVDDHLPAVASERLQPLQLRQRFVHPPLWEPELRGEKRLTQRPSQAAAVLVAIVAREHPTVLLTLRTEHLSTHSGQIAFPGGKMDASDAAIEDTALREAEEEIGLPRESAEVLGCLPLYETGTAFIVTPVVALVAPGHLRLQPNPHEVADVFEVPLSFLMNPAHHRRHCVEWQGQPRAWFSMPYLQEDAGAAHPLERFIWGATAGMLRNLYRFLSA